MTGDVTQILADRHNVNASPGKKIDCVFCGKHTLSIKRDNTLAKCFNSHCGKWINLKSENPLTDPISVILNGLFKDFHSALLDREKPEAKIAYDYLVKTRNIHPRVIEDSSIGIIPKHYKIKPLMGRLRVELGSRKEIEEDEIGEIVDKLERCLRTGKGWLAFFYADEYHSFTSIRFRKPDSKYFMQFKVKDINAGVFGHNLYSCDPRNKTSLDEIQIIVEGEFNQLQLQSLMIRLNENKGFKLEYGYVNAIALGGAESGDIHTAAKLSKDNYIFYDNDTAGQGMLERAKQNISFSAATTPGSDSDLDSHIRSFDNNIEEALDSIEVLIKHASQFYRDKSYAIELIAKIRRKDKPYNNLKAHEVSKMVAEKIVEDLKERGKLYNDLNDSYYFDCEKKALYQLDPKSEDIKMLLSEYDLNPVEQCFKYVAEALYILGLKEGEVTDVHQFGYYNPQANTLYIDNGDSQIYRISDGKNDLVDNGTDGVLFLYDRYYEPFELVDIDSNISTWDEKILSRLVFADDRMTITERKLLLKIWILALLFESIMPTKPILAFIGGQGSGKSCSAKLILRALFGRKAQVAAPPDKKDDYDTMVTNNYLAAIDNADSNMAWLPDKLAVTATGGNVEKRKLYIDNRLLRYPIKCFLIITSRTPYFNRPDVAERMLVMRLDRIDEVKELIEEAELYKDIDQNRNKLMSELVAEAQEILGILKDEKQHKSKVKLRMSDYAGFLMRIAHKVGILPVVERIIDELSKSQSDFAIEDDIIPELLNEYCDNESYENQEHTTAILFEILRTIAHSRQVEFPFKNTQSFSRKLKEIKQNLAENYEIKHRIGSRNQTFWSIKRRNRGENG